MQCFKGGGRLRSQHAEQGKNGSGGTDEDEHHREHMNVFALRLALVSEIASVSAHIYIFHALIEGEKRGDEDDAVQHAENKGKSEHHRGIEDRILHGGEHLHDNACNTDPYIHFEAGSTLPELLFKERELAHSRGYQDDAYEIGQHIIYAEKRLKKKDTSGKYQTCAERAFLPFLDLAFHKITCVFSIFSFWHCRRGRFPCR